MHYPVFYAVTGAVQGLTLNESFRRAEDTFLSIMKRHLTFWVPLQFFTLAFVPKDGQLPLILLFGLAWTVILSNLMGSAKYFSSYYLYLYLSYISLLKFTSMERYFKK